MLVELPDGDWLDPRSVRGLMLLDDRSYGPRVRIDLSGSVQLKLIEFDNVETARAWRAEFARRCNEAARDRANPAE